MSDLSILCVTRAEPEVMSLLRQLVWDAYQLDAECILAADGEDALVTLNAGFAAQHHAEMFKLGIVQSQGYVESVLDEAVAMTSRDYVLRIDDDERMSREMVEWLRSGAYRSAPHWKFCRAHLCVDAEHYVTNPPLWPDVQTRLSKRELSGGRYTIHAGSPFGGGDLAPVAIEHHKFLVKTLEKRRQIALSYDSVCVGYGTGNMLPFNLPEESFESISLAPLREANRASLELSSEYAREVNA